MGSSPKISVIVAVYNAATTLQQCIDSVANQTYTNVELLIIDGGSTDGSVDVIKRNEEKISYWVSEPDKGIYNAWNKALKQAKGDWIAFLGADDFYWDDRVLARMLEILTGVPKNIRVVYGQIMLLNAAGGELFAVGEAWHVVKDQFRKNMAIPHQGVFHKRDLFVDLGLFDESFKITADYEFLLRELLYADAFFVPQLTVAGMRLGGVSSQSKNSLLLLHELRRAQKKHGLSAFNLTWCMALIRVYMRVILWRILGEKKGRKCLDLGRKLMGKPPIWTKS